MCAERDIRLIPGKARRAGPALWQVRQFGREFNPSGRRYDFHNTRRSPAGLLVIQASLKGQLRITDRHGSFSVPEGSITLFQYADASHYYRPDPADGPYLCAWIGVIGAGVTEHANELTAIQGPVIDTATDSSLLSDLQAIIDAADPQQDPSPADLAAKAYHYLTRLYDHVSRRHQATLPPVEQAADQLRRQPLRPWSIKEIAQRFKVSREHLARTFTARHGEPPHTYLTRRRTEHAIQLLTQTSLPLADIARQSGFASHHTFARQIRSATGQAPSTIRRTHR
ncbi:MAG: AraC family transcriptional regulator [Phycisphaeraceae bacterium]